MKTKGFMMIGVFTGTDLTVIALSMVAAVIAIYILNRY